MDFTLKKKSYITEINIKHDLPLLKTHDSQKLKIFNCNITNVIGKKSVFRSQYNHNT